MVPHSHTLFRSLYGALTWGIKNIIVTFYSFAGPLYKTLTFRHGPMRLFFFNYFLSLGSFRFEDENEYEYEYEI